MWPLLERLLLAVIRPVPAIFARSPFLFILSELGQLLQFRGYTVFRCGRPLTSSKGRFCGRI